MVGLALRRADDTPVGTAAGRERRKLERWRRFWRVVAVLLATIAAMWLLALARPGNVGNVVGGVVMLELITAVPLALAVQRLRRVGRKLDAAARRETAEAPLAETVPTVAPPVAPDVEFDSRRRPDVVLRIKPVLIVLGTLLGLAFLAGTFWVMYAAVTFDPRFVMVVVSIVLYLVLAVRARIVVYDGVLWRRAFNRYRPLVSLDQLSAVAESRARATKKEGVLPFSILRLSDRYGRTTTLKPTLWTGGTATLRAIVRASAQSQGVSLDQETADRLSRGAPGAAASVPPWAYARAAAPAPGAPGAPGDQSRAAAQNPKGLRPRQLVALLGVMVIAVPATVLLSRVGTNAMGALRCSEARGLVADAPDFPSDPPNLNLATQQIAARDVRGLRAAVFALGPDRIAGPGNTAAVRRDAQKLVEGRDVQWVENGYLVAQVHIERFASHADALTFQRDWAEDHCHKGEDTFAASAVPGSVGFRCGDCRGSRTFDRLAFVRGNTRIQAIAWDVPKGDDHGAVGEMAARSAAALGG